MYNKILLPTDGSVHVEKAVPIAEHFADQYDAELHILHVVDSATGTPAATPDQPHGQFTPVEDVGEEALDKADNAIQNDDIDLVRELEAGVPHKRIVEYTNENDIDLIVMNTHGRSGVKRVVLGSVAERVIRHADAEVHIVKEKAKLED